MTTFLTSTKAKFAFIGSKPLTVRDTHVKCLESEAVAANVGDLNSDYVFDRFTYEDGTGIVVNASKSLLITGGGQLNSSGYGYSLYLGNSAYHNQGKHRNIMTARNIRVSSWTATLGTRRESPLRVMGAQGVIENSTFDSTLYDLQVIRNPVKYPSRRPHNKGGGQIRHFIGLIDNCTFVGGLETGHLAENVGKEHIEVARKILSVFRVQNCSITGRCDSKGRHVVHFHRVTHVAKDPRNIDGSVAYNANSLQSAAGRLSPDVVVTESHVIGKPGEPKYTKFAADTVIVGPGCTLYGVPVPVSPRWETEGKSLVELVNRTIGVVSVPPTPTPSVCPTCNRPL